MMINSYLLYLQPPQFLAKHGESANDSLSPLGDLHLAPPLDRHFKKAPSDKKRRKPTKRHIKQLGLPSYDGTGGNYFC